jgi:2,3-bisphosphoglycerate-independent phosphoglycerate mutase
MPTDRGQLTVKTSKGRRQRFLRGMITHDLVQRGLDFSRAFRTAAAVREALAGREEVRTAEIRQLIHEQLEELFGPELLSQLGEPVQPVHDLLVVYRGNQQPFSRGLLAQSILAAGLDFDRAYAVVTELRTRLHEEGVTILPSADLARRVAELLEEREGKEAARRYRLVRRIHRLPRPLVIYLGGASGTGKSTLALELAPLLRVYRINATDTIRQVMRMVFSQNVLPVLHSSSFEVPEPFGDEMERPGSPHDPAFVEQLTRSFTEQAARVIVGVRAVVERAIAENMSIIVEGVHLYPPLIPFKDLEGAVHQLPLMLGTLEEETHRTRFLARARLGGRRAERYLENFSAIRTIHDFVLQQAEVSDIPLIDNSEPDPPVARSLRLLTGMLEGKIPSVGTETELTPRPPTLLLIIDGLPDRPVRALGGRTPLQAAETPTLDRLAAEGQCGLADPVAPGVVPDTASGSLALFGQSPLALKRGPVEALGAGIRLRPGDIALRGNLATLDDAGHVIDRRAGRVRDETANLAKAIDRLPLPGSLAEEVEIRVKAGTEHRLAIVLRGAGLSSSVQGSDPGDGAPVGPPLTPAPLDPSDAQAVFTARILALFEQEARNILGKHPVNRRRVKKGLPPANAVLSRGAGRIHHLVPLTEDGLELQLTCIAGDHTVLGLASWLGAKAVRRPGMTANLDTDLGKKFKEARKALKKSDLVILHLKGADIAAHDQRPDLKVEFLERVDKHLANMLERHEGAYRIALASDHTTLSESGQHGADPLPVLIWGEGVEPDSVERFDEASVVGGALQRFPLQMLLGRLFNLR